MKYHLRAVKGDQLARIHFDADSDRIALRMCMDVYHNFAPETEVWTHGRVSTVAEDGTIIHTFRHCDNCERIVCEDGCGDYDI